MFIDTYAGTFDRENLLKGGLQGRNCLKWFKGEERIDVCAASPWVELAQGLIRDQQRTPPLPPPPLLPTAIGFSFTIQGLIDEPLFVFQPCTFLNLKSQFILGECKRRRELKKKNKKKKGRNFWTVFFSLVACADVPFTCVSKHFVSTSLIVSVPHPRHVP